MKFADALAVPVVDGMHYRAQVIAGDFHQHERIDQRERPLKIMVKNDVQKRAVSRIVRGQGGGLDLYSAVHQRLNRAALTIS
jgi:hypothetical protein